MAWACAILGDGGREWLVTEPDLASRLADCWAAVRSKGGAYHGPLYSLSRRAPLRGDGVVQVGNDGPTLSQLADLCARENLDGLRLVDVYSPVSLLVAGAVSDDDLAAARAGGVAGNPDFPFGMRLIAVSADTVAKAAETAPRDLTGLDIESWLFDPGRFDQTELSIPRFREMRRQSRFSGVISRDDLDIVEEVLRTRSTDAETSLIAVMGHRLEGDALRRSRLDAWAAARRVLDGRREGVRPLVLLGGRLRGHCGAVLELVASQGTHRVVAILDHTRDLYMTLAAGIPIVSSTRDLDLLGADFDYFAAVGENHGRRQLHHEARAQGKRFVTLRHPSTIVSRSSTIGEGTFLGAGAIVNHGARIGDGVIVNTGAIVEHDCVLEDYCHVGPGAHLAGRVQVREGAFVGLGAAIIPDMTVGRDALVGAGAPVVSDIPDRHTVRGQKPQTYLSSPANIYLSRRPSAFVPVAQPTLPQFDAFAARIRNVLDTKMLSNFGEQCRALEDSVARYLGVDQCVATASGTTGLLLAIRSLGFDEGEIIMPSFTFGATGVAVAWNGLEPVFADIDPHTFNLDVEDVRARVTTRTRAIIGVHVFGNPCVPDALDVLGIEIGVPVLYDAAHALGSVWDQRKVGGFGRAEVFSLSGTKIITAAEGGVIATNDRALADELRLLRNYGAGGDYDVRALGLNGKMSELHAALALSMLGDLDELIAARLSLAQRYSDNLAGLAGIQLQSVSDRAASVYHDLAILIDSRTTGVSRDHVVEHLARHRVQTKRYFDPPLHKTTALSRFARGHLPVTERVSSQVLCLPLFAHLDSAQVDTICALVRDAIRSDLP